MKSFIILVLSIGLLAAAYFTRPSQADFDRYVTEQKTTGQTGLLKVGWAQLQADQFARTCTFNDRLLWVDVQQNGKTIYTGAFGHWFNRAKVAGDVNAAKQKVETLQMGT
jgi:hypothetical protein